MYRSIYYITYSTPVLSSVLLSSVRVHFETLHFTLTALWVILDPQRASSLSRLNWPHPPIFTEAELLLECSLPNGGLTSTRAGRRLLNSESLLISSLFFSSGFSDASVHAHSLPILQRSNPIPMVLWSSREEQIFISWASLRWRAPANHTRSTRGFSL